MQVEEVEGYDQAEDDVPQFAYLVSQVTKCLGITLCGIKMGDLAILQIISEQLIMLISCLIL